MKKIISMLVCIVLLATACLSFTSCLSCTPCDYLAYTKAVSLLEDGKYEEAKTIFEELGDYKDSQKEIEKF